RLQSERAFANADGATPPWRRYAKLIRASLWESRNLPHQGLHCAHSEILWACSTESMNMHREAGLQEAIRAMGGISALARGLGITQPTASLWRRIPAERVLSVEALTNVPRSVLRPDLYPALQDNAADIDDIDRARAQEYALLSSLLLVG